MPHHVHISLYIRKPLERLAVALESAIDPPIPVCQNRLQFSMDRQVYLTKAEKSERFYDYWICGGAIVSKLHIITSAACVQDVEYMYAVSGYKKYVPNDLMDNDSCCKHTKKKVVYTCVPKAYEFDYAKIEKWAYIDIAVVKVESEFNFDGEKFKYCTYKPKAIEINFDPKYQEPNRDSIVFGWGHAEKWRKNDHGGSLVTWVGTREVLIGVASVFRVTSDSNCAGPYLYTSTQCNGIFLDCMINANEVKSRKAICDKPPIEKGFDTIERHISWKNHPDG
ncbi:unnamed protein product [Diatraea saccharalis]|uniref:Peptidase S1 domain-containing protein n=1 Tax=Diatraea saccharalis TaxID=40085 RepID=A0A9N9RE01_9NEOP|nr:unnamed protein product [Diatraea saccharalis]